MLIILVKTAFLRLSLVWKSYSYTGYNKNPRQQMRKIIILKEMLETKESWILALVMNSLQQSDEKKLVKT